MSLTDFNHSGGVDVADVPDLALRRSMCGDGYLSLTEEEDRSNSVEVSHIAVLGVAFRSPVRLTPGEIKHVKIVSGAPQVCSKVRIISCRPRLDGLFDARAEFF